MADLPVWGVHVTSSSVRGVKLGRRGEGFEILGHDRQDFPEDIEDIHSLDRHAALAHGLYVFAKRHDFNRARVVVSLDASTAFNRFVETPLVEGESMGRLLEYEAQQQIPFPLEGVNWDHKVLSVDESRNIANVMLFAIKQEVVDERLRRLAKVRFPADDFQLAPIALYNYAAAEGLAKDGLAIVSVDYDRTDIVIADKRRFWFRTLPTGVFGLVEAIREELEPRHRVAVRIARGEEEPEDAAAWRRIRDAYSERLASELGRMVEYYRGTLRDVDLRGILLVPGSSLVPPIGRHLEAATGLKVYQAKGFRQIALDPGIATPEIEENVGSFAHATGLALQGLGAAEVAVRMHRGELERDIGTRRGIWVAAVFALFVLVGLMWWMAQRNVGRLEDEIKRSGETLETAERHRQELDKNSREVEILDGFRPYVEAGRDRLVPVRAADEVLAALEAVNKTRGDDERIYLVSLATRPAELVEGRDRRREIRLILGRMEPPDGRGSAEDIERSCIRPLAARPGFSGGEALRDFQAARLSLAAEPNIDEKILRRRFRMVEYRLNFDVEGAR
ncbi:MAG: pilus assembly protein PilM [Planctomycetota bacterium]